MFRDTFFGLAICLVLLPTSAAAQGQFLLELEGAGRASPLHSMTQVGVKGRRIEVGLGGDPGLLEWIAGSSAKADRRSFAVHAVDARGAVVSTQELIEASITEVTLPVFDVSSKEAFDLAVTFEAETVRYEKGDGKAPRASSGAPTALVSNFGISLGNLPCERVIRIESLGWTQTLAEPELGRFRRQSDPKTETSNPKLTISAADLDSWQEWVGAFVREGGEAVEGEIEVLSPDLGKILATVRLQGVLPLRLRASDMEANKAGVATFEVDLSVERVSLDLTP